EKIRKLFGPLRPSKALPAKPKFEPGFTGGRQVVKNLASLPPSVSLLFPTPGYRHPDRLALMALARLLEGPVAARLLKANGSPDRLAFSAWVGFRPLEERGLLALTCCPVTAQALPAAGQALAESVARIRSAGFDDAEIKQTLQALRLDVAVRRSAVGSL